MQRTITLFTAVLFVILALLMAIHENIPATAGESTPNVTGKWEGSWSHRAGSGQITFQLVQEGTKVIGKQSVVGAMPVYGGEGAQQLVIGEEIRDGHLEDSTLIFHVVAENVKGQLNFTLTVSGDAMTGTACGETCATLKLKKAKV
jgi:hypothetical protein